MQAHEVDGNNWIERLANVWSMKRWEPGAGVKKYW